MDKKTNSKTTSKDKKSVFIYLICYVDRCNKFQNALVDTNYKIDSKEHAYELQNDLRRVTNDNFRAVVSFSLLRNKTKSVQNKGE